jgi:hypothetical protein
MAAKMGAKQPRQGRQSKSSITSKLGNGKALDGIFNGRLMILNTLSYGFARRSELHLGFKLQWATLSITFDFPG